MPYRQSKRLKRSRKFKNYAKGTYYSMNIARQLYNLKRVINVEYKFFDVTGNGTTIPDGVGTIVQLSNIPQGDTDITRDGAQVKLMSIDFKAILTVNTSDANTGTACTVALIVDKQTNGAIYATGDLLASTANVLSIVSSNNLDNKYRFKVLKRWIVKMDNLANPKVILKYHHKFHNKMKLRFESSTPSIADLNSRSLSLLFISNQATNVPQITFFNRLRYVDN